MKFHLRLLIVFILSSPTLSAQSSYVLYFRGRFIEALETIQIELMHNSTDSNLENKLHMACDIFSQLPSKDYKQLQKIYESAKKQEKHQFVALRIDAMIKVMDLFKKEKDDNYTFWDKEIDQHFKNNTQKDKTVYQHDTYAIGKVLWMIFRRKRTSPNYHPNWDYLLGKLQFYRNLDGMRELVLYIEKEKEKKGIFLFEAWQVLKMHYSRHYPSGIPKHYDDDLNKLKESFK